MKIIPLFISLLITLAFSCSKPASTDSTDRETYGNAVYYWKTVFNVDSAEMAFIRRHNIKRIYLRLFDVVEAPYYAESYDEAVPNATIRISDQQFQLIQDSLSDIEFIPTIYITLPALRGAWNKPGELASKIVSRVSNMCQYNKLPNVAELQLDCDWTESTEEDFFNLCDSVKGCIAREKLPWKLSSTIRLHQLAGNVPPVDRGVLMVYNTGDYFNQDTFNSIIDPKEVEKYLDPLSDYPLHLDVAYPSYSWQLLFRERKFVGLLNGVNLADSSLFSRKGNLYAAKRDFSHNGISIFEGDIIRKEDSDIDGILNSRQLIERHLLQRPHSTILYHLDNNNLSKYSSDEIDKIFTGI